MKNTMNKAPRLINGQLEVWNAWLGSYTRLGFLATSVALARMSDEERATVVGAAS